VEAYHSGFRTWLFNKFEANFTHTQSYSVEKNDAVIPNGLILDSKLGTGLAWDNYDVNMETIDGRNSLHATVGICYQNVITDLNSTEQHRRPNTAIRIGRMRRQFEGKETDIEPYFKQLKQATFDMDLSSVYSHFVHDDIMPLQKIWYMNPISAPPTRNDIVCETMIRSMHVATTIKQEYGVVTYDLVVALKAYSIQALDPPKFDKLLIMLGNFHLEMAFYGLWERL